MKNAKISRRSFLKAGAVASAVGMLSAAPVAAHAAETDASAAADEENGLLDVFKKPKYVSCSSAMAWALPRSNLHAFTRALWTTTAL